MSFPTLVRHDQMNLKQAHVKPRVRKPLGEKLHIPKIAIDTKKPEKVVSAPIVNTGRIIAVKVFSGAVISLLFSIGLMIAPMIASIATSAIWFIGIAGNEVAINYFVNILFIASSLFAIGATWGALHD